MLAAGSDALTLFDRPTLAAKGVPAAVRAHPNFVPAAYMVHGAQYFDAAFFGISPHEARLMDPQHRLFMQVAWGALEHAGYAPRTRLTLTLNLPLPLTLTLTLTLALALTLTRYAPRSGTPSRTAVFASSGIDGYLVHHLEGKPLSDALSPGDVFLGEVGNEKDYIATRVSYALDLMGPSLAVNSACSSALAAVAQAAQALLTGQADMALAGGAALTFPGYGYVYEEGLVNSTDGVVRPFDALTLTLTLTLSLSLSLTLTLTRCAHSTQPPTAPSSATRSARSCSSARPTRWPTTTTSSRRCSASA